MEMYKRCEGCVNEEPGQQSHNYCQLLDLATKGTESFDSAFLKVDIYLVNELFFEKVQDLILTSLSDIDL